MKTITVNLYQFSELSETAKQRALNDYINNNDFYYIWADAENTVNEFCKLTGLKTGRNSWLEFYSHNIDDSILRLSGIRLMKYFVNNYTFLYKKSYVKSFDGHKKHRNVVNHTAKNTGNKYCFYYSPYKKDNSCVLTGVCYDDDFLQPIYDFIKKPSDKLDFEDVINDCFRCLQKSIESEIESLQTEESYSEHCESNGYLFYENGQMY